MVQTAESRHGYDPASCIGNPHFFTTCRRSLPQREMRPVLVVVADVLVHQPLQMPYVQNDDVIQQISSAISPQRSATPFCHGLRKLVCLGVMPKLFTVLMTSSLKFAARSKIR